MDTESTMQFRTDYFVERTKDVKYSSEDLYELSNIVTNRSSAKIIMGHRGVLYNVYKLVRPFFSTPGSDLRIIDDGTPWLSSLEHPISVKLTTDSSWDTIQKRIGEVVPIDLLGFYK